MKVPGNKSVLSMQPPRPAGNDQIASNGEPRRLIPAIEVKEYEWGTVPQEVNNALYKKGNKPTFEENSITQYWVNSGFADIKDELYEELVKRCNIHALRPAIKKSDIRTWHMITTTLDIFRWKFILDEVTKKDADFAVKELESLPNLNKKFANYLMVAGFVASLTKLSGYLNRDSIEFPKSRDVYLPEYMDSELENVIEHFTDKMHNDLHKFFTELGKLPKYRALIGKIKEKLASLGLDIKFLEEDLVDDKKLLKNFC